MSLASGTDTITRKSKGICPHNSMRHVRHDPTREAWLLRAKGSANHGTHARGLRSWRHNKKPPALKRRGHYLYISAALSLPPSLKLRRASCGSLIRNPPAEALAKAGLQSPTRPSTSLGTMSLPNGNPQSAIGLRVKPAISTSLHAPFRVPCRSRPGSRRCPRSTGGPSRRA